MAKGSRSSVRKTNNQKLKAKVFGPVESARTERLSAKLLELAQQSKPQKAEPQKADMEVEAEETTTDAQADEQTEGMEVDDAPSSATAHKPSSSSSSSNGRKRKTNRVQKTPKHARNAMTFKKYNDGRKGGKKGGKR